MPPVQRVRLTIEKKRELIEDSLKPGFKRKEAQSKYGISLQAISLILKNKESILNTIDSSSKGILKRKSMRKAKQEAVEGQLNDWFEKSLKRGLPISGEMIKSKADQLSEKSDVKLKHTNGWLHNFKRRNDIKFKQFHGEQSSADFESAKAYINGPLKEIQLKFPKQNRWNCDETGLFFRCLPDRSLVPAKSTISGGKLPKERVTVLICCSEAGEKRKLLVIGKSKQPRGFPRNKESLPVDYDNSGKAWMVSSIWKSYLNKWDRELRLKGEKIVLFVDNCPSHPKVELTNITLEFLPPKTTSLIQPCDGGIIKVFKGHYRSLLVKRLSALLETDPISRADVLVKKIQLIDAIYLMNQSWSKVTDTTIQNCFRKCFSYELQTETESENVMNEVEIPDGYDADLFYDQADTEAEYDFELTLSDDEDETDHENNVETEKVDPILILKKLNDIRTSLQSQDGAKSEWFDTFMSIESHVLKQIETQAKVQPKITSFFSHGNASESQDSNNN